MRKVRVLIVDDSAVVRRILSEGLARDPGIEVVGTAPDPFVARDKIVALDPDVVTLDVEMPRMDGLTFLGKLMEHKPMPVVILSSLTEKGGATAMKALELGAVEVCAKPAADVPQALPEMMMMLAEKVKAAARARVAVRRPTGAGASPITATIRTTEKVVVIGASTGGTEALHYVFSRLPASTPPTVVVQHIPAYFSASFAERLNNASAMEVREAAGGDVLRTGLALVAPGGRHTILRRSGAQFRVEVSDGPLVCRQRPAAEMLFRSAARAAGVNAVGVILTGMGEDGAAGLLEMRRAGARTIGQDEASSVVYGMPRKAFELGAVERQVPLERVPDEIVRMCGAVEAV